MVSLEKPKAFIITFDGGDKKQTLTVTHDDYNEHEEFRKNILIIKCLRCDFESHFEEEN